MPKDRFYAAVVQGIHDSMERERERTRKVTRTALTIAATCTFVGSICFGWMGARTLQRAHELARISTCQQAVIDMNDSYFKAFQLKTQVDSAFTSMDGAYDLDRLSNLHNEKVEVPSTLQCSDNPSSITGTAKKAKATYDEQTATFQDALKKTQ